MSLLHAHIVFVTKYRRRALSGKIIETARCIAGDICRKIGITFKELDGEDDHIHLLVIYPPKLSLSVIAQRLKGALSRYLRLLYWPDIRKKLWGAHLWSPSWFVVSCGGSALATVIRYIQTRRSDTKHPSSNGPLIPELKHPGFLGPG